MRVARVYCGDEIEEKNESKAKRATRVNNDKQTNRGDAPSEKPGRSSIGRNGLNKVDESRCGGDTIQVDLNQSDTRRVLICDVVGATKEPLCVERRRKDRDQLWRKDRCEETSDKRTERSQQTHSAVAVGTAHVEVRNAVRAREALGGRVGAARSRGARAIT